MCVPLNLKIYIGKKNFWILQAGITKNQAFFYWTYKQRYTDKHGGYKENISGNNYEESITGSYQLFILGDFICLETHMFRYI